MAQAVVELGRVECDFIEYKKSAQQKASILKTACAYANNYMNREIGLIIIGVEEMEKE
ncbi:MAG: putative DNA binding domain-containing protein [Atopobiaceae bacterium]|nr:putative DNA binding domain-containing protein [Atopobiaceae bacterium]